MRNVWYITIKLGKYNKIKYTNFRPNSGHGTKWTESDPKLSFYVLSNLLYLIFVMTF
jgi:hypothetical protein